MNGTQSAPVIPGLKAENATDALPEESDGVELADSATIRRLEMVVFDMNDALCGLTIAEPVVAWACNNVCDVMSVFPPAKFKESGIDAGAVRDADVETGGVGRFSGGGRRRPPATEKSLPHIRRTCGA